MTTKKWELSRRTFISGAGISLALPVLNAMLPSIARAAATAPPRKPRFLSFLVPHGYGHDPSWFFPATQGAGYGLSDILGSFSGLQDRMWVIGGLNATDFAITSNRHDHSGASTYSNAPLGTGSIATVGASVDQLAYMGMQANANYRAISDAYRPINTVGYSLAENCSDLSCIYRHNMSWLSPTATAREFSNPMLLFNEILNRTVFTDPTSGTGTGTTTPNPPAPDPSTLTADQLRRRGVLHYLWTDAKALNKNLGKEDQLKLQEYLDSVDQLQRRIGVYEDNLTTASFHTDSYSLAAAGASCATPTKPANDNVTADGDFNTRINLICDLIVWAFKCDKSRIITHAVDNELSVRQFGTIVKNEVFGPIIPGKGYRRSTRTARYHTLTHLTSQDEEQIGISPDDRKAAVKDIKTWEFSKLARILNGLRGATEGDHTIFDDTIVISASGMANPHVHDYQNVPCLFKPHATVGGINKAGQYVKNPGGINTLASVMSYVLDTFEVADAKRANFQGVKKMVI